MRESKRKTERETERGEGGRAREREIERDRTKYATRYSAFLFVLLCLTCLLQAKKLPSSGIFSGSLLRNKHRTALHNRESVHRVFLLADDQKLN